MIKYQDTINIFDYINLTMKQVEGIKSLTISKVCGFKYKLDVSLNKKVNGCLKKMIFCAII